MDRNRAAERAMNMSRRHFLRGLGVSLALPAFESLLPHGVLAAAPQAAAAAAPVRMAFVYFPNGALQAPWWPTGSGREFELNKTMQPLAAVKQHIQVLGGLNHQGGYPGPDGPGDHARASGGFLSGVRVRKTAGADIHAGITIDQVVAQRKGHLTRFPSLELTCDAVRRSGSCDSGYSCAYQYNLAWSGPTTPLPPEPNPRFVFERLFGAGRAGERAANFRLRQTEQRSVLDFVMDDARDLQRQMSSRDLQRMDQYLSSLREIERRIQQNERLGQPADPAEDTPPGIPTNTHEYIRLMFGIMLLAFQSDSTRVATFLMANDGSNRIFPEDGIPEGHHYLTHHRNTPAMMEKVAQIDLFYMKQFGWFLERMEQTKDVDGQSLLHNSMIMYGGGITDGNRHTHNNLPIVLAGAGGGKLTTGRYVQHRSSPISNLYLAMGDRMGVQDVERLGDSTGKLEGL
jgi:Protein of unknown function (DUF1552)